MWVQGPFAKLRRQVFVFLKALSYLAFPCTPLLFVGHIFAWICIVSEADFMVSMQCAQVFKHFGELFKKQILSVNTDGLAVRFHLHRCLFASSYFLLIIFFSAVPHSKFWILLFTIASSFLRCCKNTCTRTKRNCTWCVEATTLSDFWVQCLHRHAHQVDISLFIVCCTNRLAWKRRGKQLKRQFKVFWTQSGVSPFISSLFFSALRRQRVLWDVQWFAKFSFALIGALHSHFNRCWEGSAAWLLQSICKKACLVLP